MSRDEVLYLEDIQICCEKIGRYASGLSLEQFRSDEKTADAIVRNLEIIGEAGKHVSQATRDRLTNIEGRKITGLRDILAHAYFGIDEDIIWDIVQHQVPSLLECIRRFLSPERSPSAGLLQ